MLVGRKTGKSKLAIPLGKLTDYLGTWAKYPGVLRALLDYVLTTAGATGELSAGTETTTMQRQIAVAGENKITSRTSEAKLDKLTASLIRRALGYMTDTTDDALLTALGFRTARCETKLDFIERLVVLQLILRRGMEFKAANAWGHRDPVVRFLRAHLQRLRLGRQPDRRRDCQRRLAPEEDSRPAARGHGEHIDDDDDDNDDDGGKPQAQTKT